MMKRREVLKTAGLVLGYTLTAGTAAAVLSGCSADPTPGWTPEFLTDEQVQTLTSIADAIVPGTETLPGAKDVNIGKFMDEVLSLYAGEEEQKKFQAGYAAFTEEHQIGSMKREEIEGLVKSQLASGSEFIEAVYEQSITGYCTSELCMKEVFVFKPIPGEQRGCVPVEEIGGIWAI